MARLLFESRCGIRITRKPIDVITIAGVYVQGNIRSDYPFTKIKLYKDKLVFIILTNNQKYEFKLNEITSIEKNSFMSMLIHHKNPKINKYILIRNWGLIGGLYKKLKKASENNNLKIKFK